MTVKEVKVELTAADILAESRQTRKRRTKKGGAEPIAEITTTAQSQSTTVISVPAPVPTPATTIATAPTTVSESPTTPTTPTTTSPTVGGVRIQTRKRIYGGAMPPIPVPSKSTTKILPIKRHATPTSLSKPKLVIPSRATVGNVGTLAQPMQPTQPTQPAQPTQKVKRRRRFTERRIGISLRDLKKSRKATRRIRKQVAGMSIPDIKTILSEKGVLKGGKQPDSMLRSIMSDYLSLK